MSETNLNINFNFYLSPNNLNQNHQHCPSPDCHSHPARSMSSLSAIATTTPFLPSTVPRCIPSSISKPNALNTNQFTVRHLNDSPDEISSAIDVLSQAFRGDQAIECLSAGDKQIASLLFRRCIQEAQNSGVCYVACNGSGKICAVAILIGPGTEWAFHQDPQFLRALPEELQEWYSLHYAPRYEELYKSASLHSRRKESWKFTWLGVHPQCQGSGMAKALIGKVCKRVDAEKSPMIADVPNPSQVSWLQRSGFTYRSVKNMACGRYPGFPLWCVLREPAISPVSNATTVK